MLINGVFVGQPSVLGYQRGEPVLSGITKARTGEAHLELSEVNLAGDAQADLSVHGGPDKAVYAYPAEHYRGWAADAFDLEPGAVGENLSLLGADESTIRIGDVWSWGDAVVEVSQPRTPCYKLGMKTGRRDLIPAMIDSGRSGWYLRVRQPGTVPTNGSLTLVERDEASPTITELYLISFANPSNLDAGQRAAYLDLARRAVKAPALAEQFRHGLLGKLQRVEARDAG
ncbi:sulfurase [Amycolatopsis albispora]|uniref:Sulfurase n=1 Tax=Amycolatopsis albispora TaxID=1804986 RepID=A0A344LL31_9PSEU|nr:sulfurase [Amycolatopsis albispora]